jgi:hypothetical protein
MWFNEFVRISDTIRRGDLEETKEEMEVLFPEGFQFEQHRGGVPLRTACECGHIDIAKYLVDMGALNAPYNHLALFYAITNGHLHIVKYLVSVGFDIRNETMYVSEAAWKNHYDIMVFLVDNGSPTITLLERHKKYVAFVQKMRPKIEERERQRRERAQKRIYYWWIPICHDPNRESGKRMMQRSFEKSMAGELC